MESSLGQRIIYYRKKAGLSQKALAEGIGISPPLLSYYENDKNDPPTSILAKLAEVLDITTDKLLGLDRPHPPAAYRNRNEYTLLRALRTLNNLGQDRALEYISELSELSKYTEKQ
ncbi:MAG: helix-turn-helix domain-containing protein [Chitinispirillia bacterium]|nr:helix-turn-helix domain-containing protein [Chitinispirillia bacterium]MCL2268614.1 helix-turn-helix domain-containing protein [Chitinispirillia bacterium]